MQHVRDPSICVEVNVLTGKPGFINLVDARFFPGNDIYPSTGSSMVRLRLNRVDAWILGTMGKGAQPGSAA